MGKAIARQWQHHGFTVTATTTTPARIAELEAVAHRAILLSGNDTATMQAELEGQHTVLLSVGAPRADAYEETYLQTAKTVVQALQSVSSVRQLIYTGSYAVYGDRQGAWVDETSPVAPANRNGEILAETEQRLLDAANDQLKVCILRLGGIYGPGRELAKIFARAAGTTRPGDGSDASNWIHLDDIVGAIDFAQSHQLHGIYNLVHSKPLTTRMVLEQVCRQNNLSPVTWDATSQSNRPYNARVSNQKLREAGYSFKYPNMVF